MDLTEIEREGVYCIYVVDPSEHGNDHSGSIKGGEFLEDLSNS
jgi:hypothetical protein